MVFNRTGFAPCVALSAAFPVIVLGHSSWTDPEMVRGMARGMAGAD
jgi:hypothetical protein